MMKDDEPKYSFEDQVADYNEAYRRWNERTPVPIKDLPGQFKTDMHFVAEQYEKLNGAKVTHVGVPLLQYSARGWGKTLQKKQYEEYVLEHQVAQNILQTAGFDTSVPKKNYVREFY